MIFKARIVSARRTFIEARCGECDIPILEKIKDIAKAKMPTVHDSWQQNRTVAQKTWDIMSGDLARKAVAMWLSGVDPLICRHILEYDSTRTDGYIKSDKFDIQISRTDVEVKSSSEKSFSTERITELLYNRRVIVNKKNEHEKVSDLLVQVFFLAKQPSLFKSLEKADGVAANKCNKEQLSASVDTVFNKLLLPMILDIDIVIVGWLDKSQQHGFTETLEDNFNVRDDKSKADKRSYADTAKIVYSNDILLLPAKIRELMLANRTSSDYCTRCGILVSETDKNQCAQDSKRCRGRSLCAPCFSKIQT